MKNLTIAMFMLLTFPAFSVGGMIFDFVPSSQTPNTNGVELFPVGHDFIVTNSLVNTGKDSTPYWLDFHVVFDHTDSQGDFFFRPDNTDYQVYILDHEIPSASTKAVVRTFIDGESEVYNLGSGLYGYHANIIGGEIDMTFNTNLELGHQVISGTMSYDGNGGTVPEPGSLALSVISLLGTACYCGYRRNM